MSTATAFVAAGCGSTVRQGSASGVAVEDAGRLRDAEEGIRFEFFTEASFRCDFRIVCAEHAPEDGDKSAPMAIALGAVAATMPLRLFQPVSSIKT